MTTLIENYEKLNSMVEAMKPEFDKFNAKKVKVSGQRCRNNLLNIKKLCDVMRKQIKAEIMEIPIKHRQPKDKPLEVKEEEVKEEDVKEEVKEEEVKDEVKHPSKKGRGRPRKKVP